MYSQKYQKSLKKAFFFLPILLVLPFVIAFDSLIYFITKPSCLSCNTLPEFLKTASLSIFLLTNAGYKLAGKK
ncbi:hypothetical protein A2767_06535 [Candidatus Roizmanbacteria bacterium RIFCSPHIGHO2_01_FULL_35_10]|uniref:Uncharacterized protein n=1 Tax=Candidatus Roizmanbacteria bacterium RIFCSPLOWO2_01_FULL_35_13 TaxID=1802055 RepID=A0A1F7IGY7_9BACT|nr:MAG: hypothetical protein A2767_06535 [Candidatus Roizmanbacteria bacterium RIFCSPHIGHO2_01_FULL_35_10]OGK42619.1 MAG: hypothetical protein A3A74_06310 [Candidatus Roizmanbacteria bacterium RIFCSPLOWO2_01_FULL_35_13]